LEINYSVIFSEISLFLLPEEKFVDELKMRPGGLQGRLVLFRVKLRS
jgi:hypothetical protein